MQEPGLIGVTIDAGGDALGGSNAPGERRGVEPTVRHAIHPRSIGRKGVKKQVVRIRGPGHIIEAKLGTITLVPFEGVPLIRCDHLGNRLAFTAYLPRFAERHVGIRVEFVIPIHRVSPMAQPFLRTPWPHRTPPRTSIGHPEASRESVLCRKAPVTAGDTARAKRSTGVDRRGVARARPREGPYRFCMAGRSLRVCSAGATPTIGGAQQSAVPRTGA